MHITSTNYTVADYCQAMINREIIVNRNYQRSDKVWPPAAKSFLIETVLLNYPIPKFSLFQKTDVRSWKTHKEIVDGQQRSQAIFEFLQRRVSVISIELKSLKWRGNYIPNLPRNFNTIS